LREHPDQLVPANNDRQPPHLRVRHHLQRLIEVVLRGEREHFRRGDLSDACCVRIEAAGDDANSDVTIGDDTHQPRFLLDDGQRAHVFLLH